MYKLIILCLLGDPEIPAASVDHTGGFQIDIQELLTNITCFNCETHVITNTSRFCPALYEKKSGYCIHRIPFIETWLDNQEEMMRNYQQIEDACCEIVEQIAEGTVLIHSFYWLSGILAENISRKYKISYVHSPVSLAIGKILGGSSPYFSDQLNKETVFLNQASHIFSITDAECEQLQSFYKIPPSKITVVGRDVHPAFQHPCRSYDGIPFALRDAVSASRTVELMKCSWWAQGAYTYVGRIQIIKGLHYIIAAWLQLYDEYGDYVPRCGFVAVLQILSDAFVRNSFLM